MVPLPSSSGRRAFNTRVRSHRRSDPQMSSADSPSAESPSVGETRSSKRRKYVPGGPGGGGRYRSPEGTESVVGGTGPGGYNYTGPRGRLGRENVANGVPPIEFPRPRRESRRDRVPARPRFSSTAAAAAAAVVHGDGFKPREERSWDEFHPDLDIGALFPVFSADEVDGIKKPAPNSSFDGRNGSPAIGEGANQFVREDGEAQTNGNLNDRNSATPGAVNTTPKRRPGRPPRRPDSMLKGIGTPEVPKVIPLPGFNPREKLTLPKPSFRRLDPFLKYEQKHVEKLNYVDRSMANVGYQESEIWIRPEKKLIRVTEGNIEEDLDMATGEKNEGEGNSAIGSAVVGRVEYDMDEQDNLWLEAHNIHRKDDGVEAIKPAIFEITMTKIEKEWHALEKRIPKPNPKPPQTHRPRSSSAAAVNGESGALGEEQDTKCAICDDGDCENTNAIVFCDGCDLAVHQECYGVPFIPEGQWLCRKCQLIGRGTPTCIFCPNTDGAFKQTNASRWSHLLCAIWIPEVSIGNNTFMEPVMDVEKVPKARWKLTCYICRQRMGACVQCGNKNCYIAFHVTCARRARLFLKMKSTHGGPASIDASVLKAFCDKHVPADWRREHDVDNATRDALDFYRRTMRGRLWADSQLSALTTGASQTQDSSVPEPVEEPSNLKLTLTLNSKKRKFNQPPKIVWRLPSGAPVIPQAVYNTVEASLQRFAIRKRKEFAAEACKFWTLKREARRGAALLKRLQLQMETFSSMEITRRNFVGMGAAGGVRLQRRIDFAEQLSQEVDKIRQLSGLIKEKEKLKLDDVKILKEIVNIVYFPITPVLWPILEKAQLLDGKGVFREGFADLEERLNRRSHTSVEAFSEKFGDVVKAALDPSPTVDAAEGQPHINGEVLSKDLIADHKAKKMLANRIVKAVKGPLEDAMRKEGELLGRPHEKELRDLERLLEASLRSRRDSRNGSQLSDVGADPIQQRQSTTSGCSSDENSANGSNQIASNLVGIEIHLAVTHASHRDQTTSSKSAKHKSHRQQPTPESVPPANGGAGDDHASNGNIEAHVSLHPGKDTFPEPVTPPLSSGGHSQPLSQGGIPWYMECFDPVGTTIEEERWKGRELVRGMSEDLSDMDEEELLGLVEPGEIEGRGDSARQQVEEKTVKTRKAAKKGRRRRNFF